MSAFLSFVADLAAGPEFDKYFADRDAALAHFGGVEGMALFMAANQLAAFRRSVDGASIVFAHSALDAAASELCWVTALSSPVNWEPFVSARKVTLGDVKALGFDQLLAHKLEEHLCALERESLLKRVDRLFTLCPPAVGFEGIRGFRFDRARLERLDGLRQAIVHRDVEASEFATAEPDVEFLFQSGLHLWAIVNAKYGVQVDVRHFIGFWGSKAKEKPSGT